MASCKIPALFLLGAAACVLLYLFLLNFPPIGLHSPTAGVIPVLVLATTVAWLTAWALRAQGWRGAALGLGRGQRPASCFAAGFLAGTALAAAWMGIVTLVTGSFWHANPAFSGGAVLAACLFHLLNNLGEELVYRGYLFLRLDSACGAAAATLTTSAAFALLHLQAGAARAQRPGGRLHFRAGLRGRLLPLAQSAARAGLSRRDQRGPGHHRPAHRRRIPVGARVPTRIDAARPHHPVGDRAAQCSHRSGLAHMAAGRREGGLTQFPVGMRAGNSWGPNRG
ncbi:type II CAAX prenyl endopeptidase Rce1 family protein [Roseateles saccharophilus]|uniref:CPBP family glutamic-type intramembrane protease n=1 Tax=Roseateles saccharophilus TaxID=304 RepID=UPI00286D4264|nr:CPBP family glutamic-type intramembrane protease [Roseateles saccharophilus]